LASGTSGNSVRCRSDDAGRDQYTARQGAWNPYVPATVYMASGLVVTVLLTWCLTAVWPSREMLGEAPWYISGPLAACWEWHT